MKLLVLEALALGRADHEKAGRPPPYVAHLSSRKCARLDRELDSIGVSYGIPLGEFVPEPREDENSWSYRGLVLADVHVYAKDATASRRR